ncbi:putative FAD-binding PCMH-type domain-containing protein [Seiridium cardinale]
MVDFTSRLTRHLKMEIVAAVARVSPGAIIYSPGSDGFANASPRWSSLDAPVANIVVGSATEENVAKTVEYTNEHNISFLAVSGGHGAITTVGQMQGGDEIWIDQLLILRYPEMGLRLESEGAFVEKDPRYMYSLGCSDRILRMHQTAWTRLGWRSRLAPVTPWPRLGPYLGPFAGDCDPQAMRKAYDPFCSAMKETPALNGSGSFFLIEGYSLAGVKAVPSATTVYGNRDGKSVVSPVRRWTPSDAEVAQAAA